MNKEDSPPEPPVPNAPTPTGRQPLPSYSLETINETLATAERMVALATETLEKLKSTRAAVALPTSYESSTKPAIPLATHAEERQDELLPLTPDGYLITDAQGIVREANRAAALLLGVAHSFLPGKPVMNFVAIAERPLLRRHLLSLRNTPAFLAPPKTQFVQIVPRKGNPFEASLQFHGVYDGKTGQILSVRWLLRDLSDRVRAETERYRLLVDNLEEYAIFLLNNEGFITSWNRGAQHIFGYTEVEAQGCAYRELFPREAQAQGLPERELDLVRRSGRLMADTWFARKDGATFAGQGVLLALPDTGESGRVGFAKILRDMTARLHAEEALRESEERFRLLVEGAKEYAMFLLDTEGRITFWSTGAQRVFGWTDAEARGESGELIFTPEDRAAGRPEEEIFTAQTTGKATDRRWHLRKDGSRFWADGILMRLDDEAGGLRGFAKVTRDATDQKRAEDALHSTAEAVARLNDELESRVNERTAELAKANRQLQAEIIERQNAEAARRDLTRRLARAQEEERRRLSRELHDRMGQYLTAFALGLKAQEDSQPPNAASRTSLISLRQIAHEMGQEIHRLAVQLRPTALDDLGLQTALRGYFDEWTERTGIQVDYDVSGLAANERLPRDLETPLYRVAQEALNNVVRHSGASKVSVLLSRQREQVVLIIEDNGKGFSVEEEAALRSSPNNPRERLGLLGMQERVQLIGGVFTVESRPGQGTTLFIRIPVSVDASKEVYDRGTQ